MVVSTRMLRNQHASGRCTRGPGLLPRLSPALMGQRTVVCRFTENPQDLQQNRAKEELIIQRQESLLQDKMQKPAGDQPQVDQNKIIPRPQFLGYQTNPIIPAWTRRKEIAFGRTAMVAFLACCSVECLFPDHPNPLLQLVGYAQAADLAVSTEQVTFGLAALTLLGLVVSVLPSSPTWSRRNREDIAARSPGPPLGSPGTDYKRFFGVSEWGFTLANELFHARVAMLGFAVSLVRQLVDGGLAGPGPMAQLAPLLGMEADDTFYTYAPAALLLWAVIAVSISAINGRMGLQENELIV